MKAWVLAVSAALHVAALALLLPHDPVRPMAQQAPLIEVELVQQPDAVQGAPAGAKTAPAAAEAPPPPPPDAGPAPPPPAQPAPPTQAGLPTVNLGNSEEWLEGLVVTGDNVVPPRPNALHRNLPPRYPSEAARRGAEGTVGLLIHVSSLGLPDQVVVTASSGDASLDRAAAEAVRLWQFTPAMAGDKAVPFDYAMDIRFVIGDHR